MENVQLEQGPKHKTAWKIIGVLALVLIILLVWQSTENNQSNNEAIEPENNQNQSIDESINEDLKVAKVPTGELPAGIPANIPLEENALIVQNDVITAPAESGQTQYTRKFVSNKSLDENYEIYKEFIAANNWEVVSVTDEATLKSLIAVNPDKTEQLFITVSENTISGEVTVDLTVIVQE